MQPTSSQNSMRMARASLPILNAIEPESAPRGVLKITHAAGIILAQTSGSAKNAIEAAMWLELA